MSQANLLPADLAGPPPRDVRRVRQRFAAARGKLVRIAVGLGAIVAALVLLVLALALPGPHALRWATLAALVAGAAVGLALLRGAREARRLEELLLEVLRDGDALEARVLSAEQKTEQLGRGAHAVRRVVNEARIAFRDREGTPWMGVSQLHGPHAELARGDQVAVFFHRGVAVLWVGTRELPAFVSGLQPHL